MKTTTKFNKYGQKIITTYQYDGKTVWYTEEYNLNDKLIKKILYDLNGEAIQFIYEYNESGKIIKETFHNSNGKIMFINEYNESRKIIKKTHYRSDGKTIYFIHEYDKHGPTIWHKNGFTNRKKIKQTGYFPNGTIHYIHEYNINKQNIKKIFYDHDGTIKYTKEYNLNKNKKIHKALNQKSKEINQL
jgi:antitoxin component YwqK of YwqJK toxin-antitoxin module